MDALALMLTKVGVRSHSKILVVEDGVGILTTAVAERLGGAAEQCVQSAPRLTLTPLALALRLWANLPRVFGRPAQA